MPVFIRVKLKLLVSAFNKVNASKLRNPTSHLSRTLPPFSPAASQLTCHHHTFNLSPCSIILISAQRKYSGVFVSDHFICEEQPPIHSIHSFCLVSRPNVVIICILYVIILLIIYFLDNRSSPDINIFHENGVLSFI